MAGKKTTTKQKAGDRRANDIAEQFEHVFMAGLGALSDAQKKGAQTFDSLVKEGEKFRKKTTSKTESLIDDVQDAIRDMADDAQSKATGLIDQVRDKSRLDKLQSAFDTRVADAMDRINVPSKNDIDAINKKLDRIIRLLQEDSKPAAKKATARKRATKKPAAKKKATKTVKKTTR
jgi:poly(hydroxyalkanoate) granule-associated protein